MGVVEAIIAKVTADPVSIAVAVLVVVLLLLVANRRQPGSGGDNVLRPVRAQDKAMQRRGVQYRDLLIQSVRLCVHVLRCAVACAREADEWRCVGSCRACVARVTPSRAAVRCAAANPQIKQLSPNVKRFRVALPSPSESLGRHGHLSVVAHIDGQRVVRPYTPVTPPWQKGYFDLVIKEYDYGTLTPHLFKLSEGDVLSVRGPYGGIKYQANEVRALAVKEQGARNARRRTDGACPGCAWDPWHAPSHAEHVGAVR